MSSSYRESANRRRDIRQQTPLDAAPKPSAARKDTKRWCRGKVGVEHKLVCVVNDRWSFVERDDRPRVLACSVCGKEVDSWHPQRTWERTRTPKPDWVDK